MRHSVWILLLSLVLLVCGCEIIPTDGMPALNRAVSGTTYYIDSVNGNDSNSGTSDSSPWKSLTKVNGTTFSAGDQILFKAGDSWSGQLYPKGSGTSGNPIVIDKYGSGSKPLIAAGGSKNNTLYFRNQEYWEINNLQVTNSASSPGDYRGITVEGRDYGSINHFYIQDCYIHDVTGEVNWIGGSGTDGNGINYATGWDASKRTGGIVFEISSTASTPVETWFNDVQISDNVIEDCSFGGIIMKQLDGSVGWGVRNSASDSNWVPHTNVVIKGNYLSQYDTSLGCNTIYLTDVQGAVVEDNLCAGAGTSAVELYYADDVVVQNNEIYDTEQKAGGADSNGIDPDKGTTNIIVQNNYVHDNGDGILFCQIGFGGDCVVRYNILQNNSRYSMNLHSSSGASANIYNNVIYSDGSGSYLAGSSGGSSYLSSYGTYILRNNIFYSATSGPVINSGSRTTFSYNAYYNVSAPDDVYAVTSDPLLVSPGSGGSGSSSPVNDSLTGYKLQSSSPCINGGTSISNNGGTDYFGNSLYNGSADIGVHEYSDVAYSDPDVGSTSQYEAEDMTLSSYSLEANSAASGGYCVKASGTGTATVSFDGNDGTYDLTVWYFDENDGSATFTVYVNGSAVDSWTADQYLGSDAPDVDSLTSRVISGVSLSNGDSITVEGTAQHYDYARFDMLECAPVGYAQYEAEDMTLSNYSLEANSAASGGYCVKTTGTGTASVSFDGSDGTYDLTVWYFDENDGVDKLLILIIFSRLF